VKLAVVPSNARMTLDGALLSSPYDARLSRDTKVHTVRVEAPGYEPVVESIKFEADIDRTFTMTKAAASQKPAAATPPGGRGAWGYRPPTKPTAPEATTAPPPPPPTAQPTAAPAAHPTTKPTNKPTIDTTEDPWQKKP
jgi:hypothetical protein